MLRCKKFGATKLKHYLNLMDHVLKLFGKVESCMFLCHTHQPRLLLPFRNNWKNKILFSFCYKSFLTNTTLLKLFPYFPRLCSNLYVKFQVLANRKNMKIKALRNFKIILMRILFITIAELSLRNIIHFIRLEDIPTKVSSYFMIDVTHSR